MNESKIDAPEHLRAIWKQLERAQVGPPRLRVVHGEQGSSPKRQHTHQPTTFVKFDEQRCCSDFDDYTGTDLDWCLYVWLDAFEDLRRRLPDVFQAANVRAIFQQYRATLIPRYEGQLERWDALTAPPKSPATPQSLLTQQLGNKSQGSAGP